jgi:predicted small metal-binding protein
MGSKYVVCNEQDFPGATKCTATFIADNDDELLEFAVRHGMNVHGNANTEAYREKVLSEIKTGTPPS